MPPKKKTESKPKAAAKPKSAPKSKSAPKPKASPKATVAKKTAAPEKEKAVKIAVAAKAAPVKSALPVSSAGKFPRHGQTQMLAFVRDPQCIFTYWEVTPESVETVKRQLQDEFKGSSMVLRVFHMGGPDGEVQLLREIFVGPDEMNRYIDIDQRSGRYFFEIAQKSSSGRLAVYARSNPIQMGQDPYSAPSGSGASRESTVPMPAGLQEYYAHEEYTETFLTPGGPSSMDSLRRKKGRYAASRI